MTIGIMWFRFDLRLEDNAALNAAVKECEKIIPVYIVDTDKNNPYKPGKAQQWWLSKSLDALNKALKKRGSNLLVRKGNPQTLLKTIIKETGATKIYCNQCYEPYLIERDEKIKNTFKNVEFFSFEGYLLTNPERIKNKTGGRYKVFTPYWRACRDTIIPSRSPRSRGGIQRLNKLDPGVRRGDNLPLQSFRRKPESRKNITGLSIPQGDIGEGDYWKPGEMGAHEKLDEFLNNGLNDYKKDRDFPAAFGTSNLSPHLHFGEISPMQIWVAVEEFSQTHRVNQRSVDTFLSQLGWREFSYYLLYHFPELPEKNWNKKFDAFKWKNKKENLKKWQQGKTGYPIIDAGMRELLETGTMHNRVRMLVASFLIKDLFIDWREGEAWFWEHLMDADLANNAASWQWVAGSGADAAPFFRIFNPVLQAKKFDPKGEYIKRWVPELENLPAKFIAAPWEAPEDVLKNAGVKLGKNYPKPIVEHNVVREYALSQYKRIK